MLYYNDTDEQLQNILPAINDLNLDNFDSEDSVALAADYIYNNIVHVLTTLSNKFVLKRKHNFYEFWWIQELGILKDKSISSNNLWKATGQLHNGPIYDQHKLTSSRINYVYKDEIQRELSCYSNDLHEALLEKTSTDFWKFGDKNANN